MQIIAAPYVQKLLETRLQMYINGVPPSPRSEPFGSSFLSGKAVWTTLPPATQLKVMQDFCDLVGLMGQQAAHRRIRADKTDLALAISSIASAISVLADPPGNGPVDARGSCPATKLNARTVPTLGRYHRGRQRDSAGGATGSAVQRSRGHAKDRRPRRRAGLRLPRSADDQSQVVIPGAHAGSGGRCQAARPTTRPRPQPTPSATPGAGNTGRPSTPPPKPAYK